MKFQVGTKVICIDHLTDDKKHHLGLTHGKKYQVLSYKNWDTKDWVHIINDRNESQSYQSIRFVSIEEYRKMKINKIKKKINVICH